MDDAETCSPLLTHTCIHTTSNLKIPQNIENKITNETITNKRMVNVNKRGFYSFADLWVFFCYLFVCLVWLSWDTVSLHSSGWTLLCRSDQLLKSRDPPALALWVVGLEVYPTTLSKLLYFQKEILYWACWYIPVIPALGRWTQEDQEFKITFSEFKESLGLKIPSQKKKKN